MSAAGFEPGSSCSQAYSLTSRPSWLNPLYRDEDTATASPVLHYHEDSIVAPEFSPLYQDPSHILQEVNNGKKIKHNSVKGKETHRAEESPPTDRNSLRSSGYGSKENDSASDTSERFIESDSESNKIPREHTDLKSPSFMDQSIRRHSKNRSSKINQGNTLEYGDDNASSRREVILKLSELKECSTLPTRVAELKRSFEYMASEQRVVSSDSTRIPIMCHRNPKYVGSVQVGVRRVKSLETVHDMRKNDSFSHLTESFSQSSVPFRARPKNQDSGTFQKENSHFNELNSKYSQVIRRTTSLDPKPKSQILRFNPLVSVVTQNSRYVTEISVSPRRPNRTNTFNIASTGEQITYFNDPVENDVEGVERTDNGEERLTRYFQSGIPQQDYISSTDYPIMSLQPDSLVTEDTLKMMTYPEYSDSSDNFSSSIVPVTNRTADLSQVMYTKGLYATLKRNELLQNGLVNAPFKPIKDVNPKVHYHNSVHGQANVHHKKKGLETVRDLWEKSGLKTNGRKLLVDIDDVACESKSSLSRKSSHNKEWHSLERSERNHRHSENYFDAIVTENDEKGENIPHAKRRGHNDDNLSQSSKHSESRKTRLKSLTSGSLLSSLGINSASNRTSLDNFGLDNFAFTDDNGDRQSVTHFLKRMEANRWPGTTGTATHSRNNHLEFENKEDNRMSGNLEKRESISHNSLQSNTMTRSKNLPIYPIENEYSELKEVIVDAKSLSRPTAVHESVPSTHQNKGLRKHHLDMHKPVWTSYSNSSASAHQEAGEVFKINQRTEPSTNERAFEFHPSGIYGSLSSSSAVAAGHNPSSRASDASQARVEHERTNSNGRAEITTRGFLSALSSGGSIKQTYHQTDPNPVESEREHLFCKIVSFFQSKGRDNETVNAPVRSFKQETQKSPRNNSDKYALHPNSAALNCRVTGALCADFTLDGSAAQYQRQKSRWAARKRTLYRTLGVVVALVVFVAVMVVLSWYITGGKRLFGPM
ncbi:hypothetical protein FHG87_004209 [Trinorchestia longiramus]|nr:hypothetical protein FHG87_004209 [Trinorchestia longiramus]